MPSQPIRRAPAQPRCLIINAHPYGRAVEIAVLFRVDGEDIGIGEAGAVLDTVFFKCEDASIH